MDLKRSSFHRQHSKRQVAQQELSSRFNELSNFEDDGGMRLVERDSGIKEEDDLALNGEEEEEAPFGLLTTSLNKQDQSFCTKYKLERGSLSAFKREAKSLRIGRDLSDVKRQENVICVWKNKGHGQFLSAASKQGIALWFTLHSLDGNLKYFFQHPYLRLFVIYFVIFCNFLVFAEDPVSHSKMESEIPVVGHVFSFIFTKYPPDWRWRFLKVAMWMVAILCGMVVGKTIIHGIILRRCFRLKMFRADQGSWMAQFLTIIISLFLFSHAYNVILVLTFPASKQLVIDSKMGVSSSNVMKAAACGTWIGDLTTALIVTDMMLQDNLYPTWATKFRKVWRSHNALRIALFWGGSFLVTSIVIMIIATDWITWDRLNRDFVATTELSRAFLASFILVMDLMILMQDWDFPHFTNTLDVNLPGFHKHEVLFQAVEIQISGKWFNYGIIFLVIIFDLNMWKNQIFYYPERYGQYTAVDCRVYTVTNTTILAAGDKSLWTYEARSQINSHTQLPYMDDDLYMNSRYMGYSMAIKAFAFIPCVLGFILFFALIGVYGRIKRENIPTQPKIVEDVDV
uniref:Transmembrane protein 117 n=3 Tax=Lepeophtheirus salmonis TaxID=72036 RepID=A0A0K2VA05_LEPSM